MSNISQFEYYTNNGVAPTNENWGSYQYVSLFDIVNNYQLMYYGNHSLVNNEEKFKILFHAKRAIQELNYDACKELKVLELNVDDDLRFILPSDYVNWVRVSLFKDGMVRPLTENIQITYAKSYSQSSTGAIIFDINNNVVSLTNSPIDQARLDSTLKSLYLNPGSKFNNQYGWYIDGAWYFDYSVGTRFGINTETANFNPTFRVDNKAGVINFSSDMHAQSCILEYITDGMEGGDNSLISVNKLFEKYVYAYITYEILNSKLGVQEYIVGRARKEKTALWRNAKIRMSNIHPGRLLMNMRGMDKIIK